MELKLNFPPSKSRETYIPDGKIGVTVVRAFSSTGSEPTIEETDMDKKKRVLSVIQKSGGCTRNKVAEESGIRRADVWRFIDELLTDGVIEERNKKIYAVEIAEMEEAEYV